MYEVKIINEIGYRYAQYRRDELKSAIERLKLRREDAERIGNPEVAGVFADGINRAVQEMTQHDQAIAEWETLHP